MRRRRIYKVHPLRMEDFAVTCPLVPGAPHLISGSCSSPRTFGLGFFQTPPHGGRPCPSPSLRLREYLARGLAPRSFCAMPGTHATLQARAIASARTSLPLLPVALQALVRCFSMAEEEIRWDTQVYAKLLNLWE